MSEAPNPVKTLLIPAGISLVIFLFLTYLLLPAWRRYRSRYASYLPLDSLSTRTSSFRDRITARWLALANRSEELHFSARGLSSLSIDHNDEQIDDGEELGDVDDHMRLVTQEHQRSGAGHDHTPRMSRELEEGFRDDSDDEPDR